MQPGAGPVLLAKVNSGPVGDVLRQRVEELLARRQPVDGVGLEVDDDGLRLRLSPKLVAPQLEQMLAKLRLALLLRAVDGDGEPGLEVPESELLFPPAADVPSGMIAGQRWV